MHQRGATETILRDSCFRLHLFLFQGKWLRWGANQNDIARSWYYSTEIKISGTAQWSFTGNFATIAIPIFAAGVYLLKINSRNIFNTLF